MKIAYVVFHFPVLSETFVISDITGMIERGHHVDIFVLDGIQDSPGGTSKMSSVIKDFRLLDRTHQLTVPRSFSQRLFQLVTLLFTTIWKNPPALFGLLTFLRKGRNTFSFSRLYRTLIFLDRGPYDIIHCQFGTVALALMESVYLKALRARWVVSFRGYDISLVLKQQSKDIYLPMLREVDLFLPVCNYFKNRLIELGAEERNIEVHRSGVDCGKFLYKTSRPAPGEKFRMISIGRLVPKKGIKFGILAVAKVAAIHRNIEYHIIGDGPLQNELQQLVEELGIGHVIKMPGWTNHDKIVELLRDSHILIAPSVTADNGDQEGIPLVLTEAMAMGLPVVSTYHSGIPELVMDGVSGFLVPEGDVEALAEKLNVLIEHPATGSEMGKKGRDFVEKFCNVLMLNDQLVRSYHRLLK